MQDPPTVCAACWSRLRPVAPPYADREGLPDAVAAEEAAAGAPPPPWRRARTAFLYEDTVARLVALLKYADRLDVAPVLAGPMARAGADVLSGADMVVPVPMHPLRLLRRRTNQAALLSGHVAAAAGVPHRVTLLGRVREATPQVGLDRAARKANLAGAFAVPPRLQGDVRGRRVVLVDDVLTTGATAEAATRALLRAGAASVDLLTAARVVRSLGEPHNSGETRPLAEDLRRP